MIDLNQYYTFYITLFYQMSSLDLITLFQDLPVEIIHLICILTGKFILDKKWKLKSIIDMRDFAPIDIHLLNMLDFKSEARRMDRQRFIKYVRSCTFDRLLEDEDRIREEVEWVKNVDVYRHTSLFLKSSPLEEVMIPLESGKFCEGCQKNCTSKQLTNTCHFYIYTDSNNGLYFGRSKNICISCFHIITKTTKTPIVNDDKYEKTKIIKMKEKFPKRKSLNNNEKIYNRPVNYKKNFRRLV